MKARTLGTALLLALVAPLAVPAAAWDTVEDGRSAWRSIYVEIGANGRLNEHALIAHNSLKALGLGALLGFDGTLFEGFWFADVNDALFPRSDDYDADRFTFIEERAAPSPAQFAGLPDFSYSIYDWINKNDDERCPGVPAGVDTRGKCHEFSGWLGAGFNASHFGTQARELYLHLHAIALDLAARARELRERLETHPIEAALYRSFILEAQLEALYYEGYAQHYLQDRWSMGHMWERWNGADYDSMPNFGDDSLTFYHAFAVGALSGLLHGSESLRRSAGTVGYAVGLLDPMCSPVITPSMRPPLHCPARREVFAEPVRFRTPAGELLGGVGDYLYLDMLAGRIDAQCITTLRATARDYHGLHLPVLQQRDRMASCAAKGWAEVLVALGDPQLAPSHIPSEDLGLKAGFRARDSLSCWGNWATNEAMYQGWVEDGIVQVGSAVRAWVGRTAMGALGTESLRYVMGDIGAKITSRALASPNGTDLARGKTMPALFWAKPGNEYVSAADPVPDWAMPRGFEDPDDEVLPYSDPSRGRDQITMFGFFNRAHGDFWCKNPERIAGWRGSEGADDDELDKARIEACTLLADRFYRGTDSDYHGQMTERREVNASQALLTEVPYGTPYAPWCELLGVEHGADPEVVPVEIHPGYVGSPGDYLGVLHEQGWTRHASIDAWCRQVPIADYLWMASASARDRRHWDQWKDVYRWNVVSVADRKGGEVTLHGRNFAAAAGIVRLLWEECHTTDCGEGGGLGLFTPVEVPYRVAGDRLSFDLPSDMKVGDFTLVMVPSVGPEPVGRFLLRVLTTPLSAPIVLSVEMGQLKPGGATTIEAKVWDGDGWIDLDASKGAYVKVGSAVLADGVVTLDKSSREGPETATFTSGAPVLITTPLSDRLTTCPPPEYPVHARATDTGLSVDPDKPEPKTGTTNESDALVLNCVPEPGTNDFTAPVTALPGGPLAFTVAFRDDNHDGSPECNELPAADVEFTSQPPLLFTTPELPAAVWTEATSSPPERSFKTSVTVENPHRDGPFSGSITTVDDLGTPSKSPAGPVKIEVLNVAPAIVSVVTSPSAVHPNTSRTITVTVVASDDNTWEDLDATEGGHVVVDLTRFAGGKVDATFADGVDKRWSGARTATIRAPVAIGPVSFPVTAIDDNGLVGLGEGFLNVRNVPPELTAAGLWDGSGVTGAESGSLVACGSLSLGAIASDANRDALRVKVRMTQSGRAVDANLTHDSHNFYKGTIATPCQGTWKLTYTAIEVHPAGSSFEALESGSLTLSLTVMPALNPCLCKECICFGRPNGSSCNDCITCTVNEKCQNDICIGPLKTCLQDSNPCTIAKCDPNTGNCETLSHPDGTPCDDEDVCTAGDACFGGVCRPGIQVSGCCHTDAECDDGDPCTLDDCIELTGMCVNTPLEGSPCDDEVNCTLNDVCFLGACSGIPLTCAPLGNVCVTVRCDESDGRCKSFPANQGGGCNDGDPCTFPDRCQGGVCVGASGGAGAAGVSSQAAVDGCCRTDADCDDGNPCTDDDCDEPTGICSHTPIAGPLDCDDDDACTTADACAEGECEGLAVTCPPTGNPCATDGCDATDGLCKPFAANEGGACDDGDPCTADTTCTDTVCGGGTPVTCCEDDVACQPEGPCDGSGAGVCEGGACLPVFPALQVPPGGALYPQQGGAPAATLPQWLDFAVAEVRYGLPSAGEPCDRTGMLLTMRAPLPDAGDSVFIDIGIWYFKAGVPGDPGTFGPPLQGATHNLSVSWDDIGQQWQGHLWVFQPNPPGGSWVLADPTVPFVVDGDMIGIEHSIPGLDGCVPHKLLTQYVDANGDLVWKMATAGDAGISLDPSAPPLSCP